MSEYDSTMTLVETTEGFAVAPKWMADMLKNIHGNQPVPVGDEVTLDDVVEVKVVL